MISQRLTNTLFKSASTLVKTSFKRTNFALLRNLNQNRKMSNKTEEEWRAVLSPEQFRVLRQHGTEAPYAGEYTNTPATETGVYECAGCKQPIYKSSSKFIAHCGWPAFYEAVPGALKIYKDSSLGMVREEMRCSNCDGHLGHIFRGEGYKTPTDARHCVNSISIKFNPESK